MRRRQVAILLGPHALQRWRERVGNESVQMIVNKVRTAINYHSKIGLIVNKQGACEVYLGNGIDAVVIPGIQGGWVIKTFRENVSRKSDQHAFR